jgi:2,3-bisphosphoglycerate-dependent phosphoglycerate mutase
VTERLFVFARHAESSANAAQVINSDPDRPVGLTPRGRRQAQRLGEQIANLRIDLAVCTRFLRTRQTAELALRGRKIPLQVEPALDEVQAGAFDGAPIRAYWAWKERHARSERFPHGESLDDAARRHAEALRRLLARPAEITLIVCHELGIRYVAEAAARADVLGRSTLRIPNAAPFLLDGNAVARALECLDVLAPPAVREVVRPVKGRRVP